MTFVVNTIKQVSTGSKNPQNIQFLIDIESPLLVRKIIEQSGLVLLSLTDFSGKPESFGPVYVVVVFDNQKVRIVGKKDFSLKDFVSFCFGLGFIVEDANYFVEAQTPEQIKKIFEICKKELDDQKSAEQAVIQKVKDTERKIYYEDDGLEKAKKVIAWSLEKVNTLLTEKGAFVSAKDLRTIKEKVEELKKLRMGTNYEKIRDMLQELFSMVDHIEEDYYASLEDTSQAIFSGTKVTEVDLERQVSILEKVQQQQMFGGNVPVKRKDYVAFGAILVYLMFLKKDFLEMFQNIYFYVYRIFDWFQIGLLMICIILGGSILYLGLFSFENSLYIIYYSFFSLGFLGILAFIFSRIKAKNPLFVALLFVFMIVIYFVGIPLLKHTFALS